MLRSEYAPEIPRRRKQFGNGRPPTRFPMCLLIMCPPQKTRRRITGGVGEVEEQEKARAAKIMEAACRLVEAVAEQRGYAMGGGRRWERLQQLWALHATDPTFTGISRLFPPPEEREGDEWKRETED